MLDAEVDAFRRSVNEMHPLGTRVQLS